MKWLAWVIQNCDATMKRCERFIPGWPSLNRMGHSRILRSSYLWLFAVPFLALILAKTGPGIHVPLGKSELTITLGLPFSWKMFYFSSVAFALASLLYSTLCPAIIRDYPSFAEFNAEGRGPRETVRELFANHGSSSNADVLTRKGFIKRFQPRPGATGHDEATILQVDMFERGTDSDAFFWVRERCEKKNPWGRFFCAVSYAIGFGFIGFVLWQNFQYVWRFV